jgi:hypothetical protein
MQAIVKSLKANDTDCLHFATDKQINKLVSSKKISADYLDIFKQFQDARITAPVLSIAAQALQSLAPAKPLVELIPTEIEVQAIQDAESIRKEITARREIMAKDAEQNAQAGKSGREIAALFDNTYKFNWTLRRDGKGVDSKLLTAIDLKLLNEDIKAFKQAFENAGADNFDQRISYLKKLSLHALYKDQPINGETETESESESEADAENDLQTAYEQSLLAARAYATDLEKGPDVIAAIDLLMSEQGMEKEGVVIAH